MRLAAAAMAIITCTLISCSGKESAEEQPANTCGPSPFSVRPSEESQQNTSEILKGKGSAIAGSDDVGEVVGQMSWHLCNARANGWIDDAFYRAESIALRQAIFTKMGIGAPSSPAPDAMPGNYQVDRGNHE